MERLGEMFSDYRVYVYENDSDDHTPELLTAWAGGNPRVRVDCERRDKPPHRPVRCLNRAAEMARCRARCQDFVRTHCPDVDVVCVLDLDLAGGFSLHGACHTFGAMDWDFVGSYGIIYQRQRLRPHVPLHYDVWAFRREGSYAPLDGKEGNLMSWRRGDPMTPVFSCFGGLGFYRTQAWLAADYGGEDCEHVVLHRRMRERGFGRIFLNPSQIVVYGRRRKRWDRLAITLHAAGRAWRPANRQEYLADAA